jgi:hypothetical protein
METQVSTEGCFSLAGNAGTTHEALPISPDAEPWESDIPDDEAENKQVLISLGQ